MNVDVTTLTQTFSTLATKLKHDAEKCGRFTKQIGNDCLKITAKVTVAVGPPLARLTTPLALMLAGWASAFIIDDYLIFHAVDWKDWDRCISGLPNEQGIYKDYSSNGSYGFQKRVIRVLKQTMENVDDIKPCADDLSKCQTCSRPDFMGGSSVLFDQTPFAMYRLLPAALALYLSGKALNRLTGAAKQYLYNCNDSIKLGESMSPLLSATNPEQNYQIVLNLSKESKISSLTTDVVLDKLSMISAILPKRIPAPFIESEDERIKIIFSLALSALTGVLALDRLANQYPLGTVVTGLPAASLAYYGISTLHGHIHSQQLSNQIVPIINELGNHIKTKTTEAIKSGKDKEINSLRVELKTILNSKISLIKDIYYQTGFYKKSILDMVRPLETSLKENIQALERI